MSNLDTLVGLDAAMGKSSRVERTSKPRLIADPSVSVADLMKVLRDFVTQKDCKDILSLVVPAGHRNFSWKTAVDPNWLQRMSSLVFDILAIAPNSKVQGKKLEQALKKMLVDGDLKNESKRDDKTYVDSVNQLIRIALSQFRILKTDIAKREICYKRLSAKEKKGFALILDRLQLPADYENLQSDENRKCPVWRQNCLQRVWGLKWWHTLQLILMPSPPLVQFWKVLPCQPLALHHLILPRTWQVSNLRTLDEPRSSACKVLVCISQTRPHQVSLNYPSKSRRLNTLILRVVLGPQGRIHWMMRY